MFVRLGWFVLHAPDNGAGTGGGTGNGNAGNAEGEGGQNGDGSDNAGKGNGGSNNDAGKGGSGTGDGNGGKPPKVEFTAEQQAEVNRITAETKRRERAEAKREADEAKLKEQGEFQKLHDALETRVKSELEPKALLADELAGEVNTSIDEEVKEWPESLKKQDPGKDNVKARLTWVRNSRELAKELQGIRKAPEGEHGKGSDVAPSATQVIDSVLLGRYSGPPGAKVKK